MPMYKPMFGRRFTIAALFAVSCFTAAVAAASAATVMVLSDSAGVYLIDTASGAIVQSYGNLFTGTSAQNLAQDLSGNLYVTNASGQLVKATFNANAPTSATAYSAGTVVGTIAGLPASPNARLSFDPTTMYCTSGCLVTMSSANTVLWVDPATAAVKKTLTLSASIGTNGDIVVVPTAANNETLYVVATQSLYTINASTGNVTGPVTLSGPTGALTGLAMIPNGHLVACEQIGSGSPWTLWEYTTAGTQVGSHTGITTGSDVVNDLASVPATFTVTKTGTTLAGPGDSMLYAVAMKNTGFFTYPTGAITDPVPANVTISSTTPPSCAVSGGTGTCTITSSAGAQTVVATVTNLSSGATATVSIAGTPSSSSGTAVNTARASVPYDPTQYGGETLTSGSVTTTFTAAALSKQVANITESIGPGTSISAKPGDVLEYTLTFTNRRAFAIQSFSISDTVDANSSYVTSSATCVTTPGPLTCTPSHSAGVVTFAYAGGSLAVNGTIVAKFRVTVN
ncbi:MAG TPA: hypothetical protein VHS78_11400 [Candidatus Elarobacter sp.]|jgi:uncharacterized repeat protein (TIGR01451 family)|nr:hypothetical protein [Candidatus Elarobacter sp.]